MRQVLEATRLLSGIKAVDQIKIFRRLQRQGFSAPGLIERRNVEPPPVLGELLRQAFLDDYTANLQFELISLLLILSHVPTDEDAL